MFFLLFDFIGSTPLSHPAPWAAYFGIITRRNLFAAFFALYYLAHVFIVTYTRIMSSEK